MKPFDICIAYVSWGGGGKRRPVLMLSIGGGRASLLPITSQYENKSDAIKAKYFKIDDWQAAGLAQQSYADTGTLLHVPAAAIDEKAPIGALSARDKQRLLAFLTN